MNKQPFPSTNPLTSGAFKIAGIYLLIGILWILFSDRLAERIALNKEMLANLSLYKGWAYVIVTAVLLYWLVQRQLGRLHASEKQLQVVINALPVLISYIDKNQHYLFANESYEEWFGENAQGKHIEEVVGHAIYQKTSKYVDKVLSGVNVTYETEIPFRDGSERFVSATYVPDIAENGQVKGFFTLVQDISEQKESREKLRQWADAFEGCAHGIALGDPDTNRIVVCNPAFANMLKCRVEEIVGRSILSLYSPSDHEHVRSNVIRADQIGHVRFEARMVCRDNSTFPVQMDLVSVTGDDGELVYRVATAQDISERKRAEEELKRSEERYRYLFENNPYPMWIYDRETLVFLNVNEAAIEKYGYSRQEFLNMTIVDIRPPEDIEKLMENLAQPRRPLDHSEGWRHCLKDGTIIYVEITSHTLEMDGHASIFVIAQDITERVQTQNTIRLKDELLHLTSEMAKVGGWEFDAQTQNGTWTDEVARIHDLEPSQPTNVELGLSFYFGESRARVEQAVKEAIELAKPYDLELEMITAKGNHKWVRTAALPILDEGKVIKVQGIFQDITERKWAEEQLERNNQILNEILVSIQDDFYVLDRNWNFVYASRLFTSKVGKEPADFIGNNIWKMFPKHVGTILEENFREAMETREVRRFEIGGKYTAAWYRMTVFPSAEGITVLGTDITERKKIEDDLQKAHDELEVKVQERTAALSQANALLQALMDYMPDQIYFKDTQCRFIRNSRAQATLLGLSDPVEVIGKTDFDFFPHAARAYAEEQEVMKTGKSLIDFEEWVVWPDGKETWVSTTKVPLLNSDRETIGIFGISRDITERKRSELAIQQLNQDLEKQAEKLQVANKELEAFSYSVSHDLRAPLRAIDGYTRILVEDYESKFDAEGKRICGVISAEARRMGQLIDDLLAFSRLGRKEMYSSNVDMKALVVSVLNELIKDDDRERIDFKIARLPSVSADASLMRQVWVNLLSNALKFTSKKERATIEVGCKSSKEEIVYFVRDTGAGFDMEYANKLFGVFQRLHSESEFEGTGVGLAIVQRIIRRHDGRVWAEGQVDQGATFYFALPRKDRHHE